MQHREQSVMFGVTGVTVEQGQPNVLVLGADTSGPPGNVLLRLMYLDHRQFAAAGQGWRRSRAGRRLARAAACSRIAGARRRPHRCIAWRAEGPRRVIPPLDFPEELPIAEHREAIARAIAANQVVIVAGRPAPAKPPSCPRSACNWGAASTG